jgi:hypothetical protein
LDPALAKRDFNGLGLALPSLLDKIRDRLGSGEEVEKPELEEEVEEPNLLEGDVVAGSGLEVSELVGKIVSERHISMEEASRGVYRAIGDGKVRFVDPSPPSGFLGFFSLAYSGWFWGIIAFIVLLLYSIYLMPQIYPLYYIRFVVGGIFILYVPGFTLIEALYPKRDELERLERFALSVGLSIAVVPLVGLVLNYTPWGIRLDPALVSLAALTVVLGVVGVYRKYGYWRLAQRARENLS